MKNKSIKLFIIIAVCLVAAATLILALVFTDGGEQNGESNADNSVNTDISKDVNDIETSTESDNTSEEMSGDVSEEMPSETSEEMSAEVSEEISVPENSVPEVHTHQYGQWTIEKEATEESEGSKKRVCSCGHEETEVIPALSHTHSHSAEWSSNETDHWKVCKCGDKSDIASHTFNEWTTTKEATETTEGSKYRTCDTCEYKEIVTVPVLSHTHSFGTWKNNATSHWKECKCGEKDQLSAHTYGNWTTVNDAACTVKGAKKHACSACGYSETVEIPATGHSYGDWKNDKDNHWKECSKCKNVADKYSHNYTHMVTQPTETEKGYTTHVCDRCEYTYVDSYVDPVVLSKGLEYEVNEDGVTCTITGIGTCTDTALYIPSEIDGYKVTAIGYYSLCNTNITSVIIPEGVKSLEWGAFSGCQSLAKVSLPNSLTVLEGGVFERCFALTSIVIPDKVTVINARAFSGCYKMTEVTIGKGVTQIGNEAFYNCGLKNVIIPDNVAIIGDKAFAICYDMKSITFGKNVTEIGEDAFGGCRSLTEIVIPDSVTHLGYGAFTTCTALAKVTLGNGITKISPKTFIECIKLAEITIPDGVTEIGEKAFNYCPSLTKISLPDSITKIGKDAFYDCKKLENVYFRGEIDDWVSIAFLNYASNPCSYQANLYFNNKLATDITIPDSINKIYDNSFVGVASLKSITISDKILVIGRNAFSNCKNLTDITFGKNLTEIEYYAFSDCTSLVNVTIPDSVTKIGEAAFQMCDNLTSLTIGNGTTHIGRVAFNCCTNLKTVTLGKNITDIESDAFSSCDAITDVYYKGSETDWNKINVGSDNLALTNAKIHYNN